MVEETPHVIFISRCLPLLPAPFQITSSIRISALIQSILVLTLDLTGFQKFLQILIWIEREGIFLV